MDRIDRKIVEILLDDASISNLKLASLVGLAPSSCLRRVAILRKNGTLSRVIALPNREKIGLGLRAIVTVKLKDHDTDTVKRTAGYFSENIAVSQVCTITGDSDLFVIISASNMADFQKTMHAITSKTDNIEQYFTCFVIDEFKFEPGL